MYYTSSGVGLQDLVHIPLGISLFIPRGTWAEVPTTAQEDTGAPSCSPVPALPPYLRGLQALEPPRVGCPSHTSTPFIHDTHAMHMYAHDAHILKSLKNRNDVVVF